MAIPQRVTCPYFTRFVEDTDHISRPILHTVPTHTTRLHIHHLSFIIAAHTSERDFVFEFSFSATSTPHCSITCVVIIELLVCAYSTSHLLCICTVTVRFMHSS